MTSLICTRFLLRNFQGYARFILPPYPWRHVHCILDFCCRRLHRHTRQERERDGMMEGRICFGGESALKRVCFSSTNSAQSPSSQQPAERPPPTASSCPYGPDPHVGSAQTLSTTRNCSATICGHQNMVDTHGMDTGVFVDKRFSRSVSKERCRSPCILVSNVSQREKQGTIDNNISRPIQARDIFLTRISWNYAGPERVRLTTT